MKRIVTLLISLITIFPISIKAYECSNTDRERLQVLANNITVTLEEQENRKNLIIFSGLSNELKIYSETDYANHYNATTNNIGETRIENVKNGKSYQFKVTGYLKCYNTTIRMITVNIPSKNPYYGDEICNEASEYSLCQKWTSVGMTHDEFIKKVNEYIENKKDSGKDHTDANNTKNSFFEFYEKFYWPIFVGMICILVLLIFLWIKENKKNKL